MKYKINCGYCGEEIRVSAENEIEGMKKMKEEAAQHNHTNHPEERVMSDDELEKDIESKWKVEED